jgi:hypothetical protein
MKRGVSMTIFRMMIRKRRRVPIIRIAKEREFGMVGRSNSSNLSLFAD